MFCILFTCFYGVRKISAENVTTKSEEYQGVLSLWQIDSFEGGIGSRKQFLLKIARGFEKKHKGVLVMVTNITKDGAEENFKNGIYPDMISYGNGVDVKNFSEIKTEKIVKGGKSGMVNAMITVTNLLKNAGIDIKRKVFKEIYDNLGRKIKNNSFCRSANRKSNRRMA